MYSEIRKYIGGRLGKHVSTAIVATTRDNMDVGLPCLLDFTNVKIKKMSRNAKKPDGIEEMFKNRKDLPRALNALMNELPMNIPVLYPFPSTSAFQPAYINLANANSYHCIKARPIHTDSFKSSEIKTINGIAPAKAMPKLAERMREALKNNRYVNYVWKDICKSKIGPTMDGLHKIAYMLGDTYSNNACVYYRGNGNGTLIDMVSISFYKLQDVIPIFDTKRVAGIVVELLFTNSLLKGENIVCDDGNYVSMRWLFSRHRDNTFTIDGERIKRDIEYSVHEIIDGQVYSLLKKSTPDDTALKKAKSSKKGE